MRQLQQKTAAMLPFLEALSRHPRRMNTIFPSSCRPNLVNTSRRISSATINRETEPRAAGEDTAIKVTNPDALTSNRALNTGSLPSTTEGRRLQASKKLSKLMDELLSRASIAGQHINEYTGTDYTAIDALRKEISKQEEVVKSCAAACNAARLQQQEAHNDQSNASREIVGLLERKSSWSPVDLERYMALVRSDHINEQAVQAAKDNLTAMEQNLDEARALLERLERKRYHEEQIWSDTIRRNSTWVTFGLMGVNIILLLAQITIFEPYRRKKIAKDVEEMLETRIEDTKSNINEDKLALLLARVLNNDQQNAVAEDEAPGKYKDQPHNVRNDLDPFIAPSPKVEAPIDAELAEKGPRNAEKMPSEQWWSTANLADGLRESRAVISDQFSERLIQLRKVDITQVACISAVAGAAISGGIIMRLLRPT